MTVFPNALMDRYGGFGGPPPAGSQRRRIATMTPPVQAAQPRRLLNAPAPVPLARLLPLEILINLRDQAAHRLAALTPRRSTGSPVAQESSTTPAALPSRMLIGD